jgi:hypothetical protein
MIRPLETGGPSNLIIPAPRWVWIVITVSAALAGAAMAIRSPGSLRQRLAAGTPSDRIAASRVVFLFASLAVFMTPMVVIGFFDRYLISCIAFATALCLLTCRAERPSRFLRAVGVMVLALYAGFGVSAAHDYFEWNRARWQAIHGLQATGRYRANEIDGGVEYAGLYGYHRREELLDLPDAIIFVAAHPFPGTTVCGQVPWRRWLPPRHESLWIVAAAPQTCP